MAPRKKPTPAPTEDARFAAHGVSDEELRTAREDGYSVAFLYETKGLTLDHWEKVWFAFRASKEEEMQRVMNEAIRTGNARNPVRIEF
jgi:hypothetical protein